MTSVITEASDFGERVQIEITVWIGSIEADEEGNHDGLMIVQSKLDLFFQDFVAIEFRF